MKKRDQFHDLSLSYHRITRLNLQHVHAALEPIGVFPGQPPILFLLSGEPGLTQKQIGEAIFVRAATLTSLLQRMEKSELIVREQDVHDHRKMRVFLTEKGHQKTGETREMLADFEQKMFVDFSDTELILFEALLEKIERNLRPQTE
ncbi:MAG: MarR family winged helix-turn-helix transcriptional regulator [Culicoidibacterales bacterium]